MHSAGHSSFVHIWFFSGYGSGTVFTGIKSTGCRWLSVLFPEFCVSRTRTCRQWNAIECFLPSGECSVSAPVGHHHTPWGSVDMTTLQVSMAPMVTSKWSLTFPYRSCSFPRCRSVSYGYSYSVFHAMWTCFMSCEKLSCSLHLYIRREGEACQLNMKKRQDPEEHQSCRKSAVSSGCDRVCRAPVPA